MAEEECFPAWSKTVEECVKHYDVEVSKGLSKSDVERKRKKYGWNELQKEPGKPMWKLVLEQFDDTLVKILLFAALVSFVLAVTDGHGEDGLTAYVEPLVILMILILNASVGVWQESNAENALEALKEMQSAHAEVIREGVSISDLPARELVPGDIVELRVGDKVPADMRVVSLKTSTVRVEQSALTGESVAVLKSHQPVKEDIELQGKECMVFAGTVVVNGSFISVVVSTGMNTEIGKIQSQIQAASLEENNDTPLKKKLDELGERLTKVIGVICALVWIINYEHFLSYDVKNGWQFSFEKCTYYFKIAVALAVAAIPEGLPAVITTCLALGTKKMAAKNAIVRKLPSVETLGCTTVICSDKTGTLTTNQMSVMEIVLNGASTGETRDFHVQGTTYNFQDGYVEGLDVGNLDRNMQSFAEIASLCNDSGVAIKNGAFRAVGMPTEAALKILVEKMGVPDKSVIMSEQQTSVDSDSVNLACNNWWSKRAPRLAILEFDRTRKSMSTIINTEKGYNKLLVKGAVETVLERSSHLQLSDGSVEELAEDSRNAILAKLHLLSSKALRCLGFAYKDDLGDLSTYDGEAHNAHTLLLDPVNYAGIESGLVFVGMAGLRDPPREEVRSAIQDCSEAGIRVMVITGDNKNTAEAICREIGVFSEDEDIREKSYTGREFMELPLEKRKQILFNSSGGRVFSRAEPKHKQDIVRMLKDGGEVVAMTGDGVNDAPALKLADIGVAMGISGTEVAKEAADMVLADDNFSTIVAAIGEGRAIYNNVKAFIRYMISSNMGEVASIFLTAALGLPEGLIPVQLLWVNLVTDGPPATALGFNAPDPDIMKKPPRKSTDALINTWVLLRYVIIGMYIGIATVGAMTLWYTQSSFLGIDLSSDGHTLVTFEQLRNWGECSTWKDFKVAPFTAGNKTYSFDENPCEYFTTGKVKATTMTLSVLVAIEMLNSLNALSENGSLLETPPWANPWLLLAMLFSFTSHFLILYVPILASIFGIVPLSFNEWLFVFILALPVILVDEVLKFIGRRMSSNERKKAAKKVKFL
jgi:Ca2+-transporting ATPase